MTTAKNALIVVRITGNTEVKTKLNKNLAEDKTATNIPYKVLASVKMSMTERTTAAIFSTLVSI